MVFFFAFLIFTILIKYSVYSTYPGLLSLFTNKHDIDKSLFRSNLFYPVL